VAASAGLGDHFADLVAAGPRALLRDHLANLVAASAGLGDHFADLVAAGPRALLRDHLADLVGASAGLGDHFADLVTASLRALLRDHLADLVGASAGLGDHFADLVTTRLGARFADVLRATDFLLMALRYPNFFAAGTWATLAADSLTATRYVPAAAGTRIENATTRRADNLRVLRTGNRVAL